MQKRRRHDAQTRQTNKKNRVETRELRATAKRGTRATRASRNTANATQNTDASQRRRVERPKPRARKARRPQQHASSARGRPGLETPMQLDRRKKGQPDSQHNTFCETTIWAQGARAGDPLLVCEPLNAGLPPKKHLHDLTHRARRSCPNRALTNTETHRHTAPGRSCAAAVTRVGENQR